MIETDGDGGCEREGLGLVCVREVEVLMVYRERGRDYRLGV